MLTRRLRGWAAAILLVTTPAACGSGERATPPGTASGGRFQGRTVVPDLDTRGAMTADSVAPVPYALDRLAPALTQALSLPPGR